MTPDLHKLAAGLTEVTQLDRCRMAELHPALGTEILSGHFDNDPTLQAFAAHREQAAREAIELKEENARLREAIAQMAGE